MIIIRIPATSANMGPGFDCLGIALNLYTNLVIEEVEEGLEISGCEEAYSGKDNLIYTSMLKCFEKLGYKAKGISIRIESEIPISRGLGSSAACILGGVLAANELSGAVLSKEEILGIATEIEGHPDNIAPALFGGMVASIMDDGKVYHSQIKLADGLKLCALIPDFTLSTKEARAALPDQVEYADAVFNISRSSLLVSALSSGSFELIKLACQDRLHQPYRSKLIPGYEGIVNKCKEQNCLGVFLSGAGPTIMVILEESDTSFSDSLRDYLSDLEHIWIIKELQVDREGAVVISGIK